MSKGVRAAAVAALVALGSTGIAAAMETAPTGPTRVSIGVPVPVGVSAPVPAPAAAPTSPAQSSQSATQIVQLAVIGGDLELVTEQATVDLHRIGGSQEWVGTLPPVRVVDARGTHEGWEVRWKLAALDVDASRRAPRGVGVSVAPTAPTVVHGVADGLYAGRPGTAGRPGRVLFGAQRGGGGGTYEAGASVTVRLPRPVDASRVVVTLDFALG